jgi:hypothetical protein
MGLTVAILIILVVGATIFLDSKDKTKGDNDGN